MLQIGQFAGGGDTQSSGFIAAYDLATGKFDGLRWLPASSSGHFACPVTREYTRELARKFLSFNRSRLSMKCEGNTFG
jgi:hypothetical protein